MSRETIIFGYMLFQPAAVAAELPALRAVKL